MSPGAERRMLANKKLLSKFRIFGENISRILAYQSVNLDPLNELLNKRVVSVPEQNAFRYANDSLADRKKKKKTGIAFPTLVMRGWLQRRLCRPWCIQFCSGVGQCWRRRHFLVSTHHPHSNAGGALRHWPQLERCASHLYSNADKHNKGRRMSGRAGQTWLRLLL